jgi:hypothetical protein
MVVTVRWWNWLVLSTAEVATTQTAAAAVTPSRDATDEEQSLKWVRGGSIECDVKDSEGISVALTRFLEEFSGKPTKLQEVWSISVEFSQFLT